VPSVSSSNMVLGGQWLGSLVPAHAAASRSVRAWNAKNETRVRAAEQQASNFGGRHFWGWIS